MAAAVSIFGITFFKRPSTDNGDSMDSRFVKNSFSSLTFWFYSKASNLQLF